MKNFKYLFAIISLVIMAGCSSTPAQKINDEIENDLNQIDHDISKMQSGLTELRELSGKNENPPLKYPRSSGSAGRLADGL